MGYFPKSKLRQAIDSVAGDETIDVLRAGEIIQSWEDMDRCLKKVDDDEPIFVLRAQDESAPSTIHDWIARNPQLPRERAEEARQHMAAMLAWQKTHPDRVKRAD